MNWKEIQRLLEIDNDKQTLLIELMTFVKAKGLWEEFEKCSTIKIVKELK
jgi:hypothetical protein